MLILDKLLAELLAQSQPSLLVLSGSLALCACFNFRISAFRFKSAVRGRFLITVWRLAKVAIFTTNVDAENEYLINHKTVCGALNRHFCQTPVEQNLQ